MVFKKKLKKTPDTFLIILRDINSFLSKPQIQ